MRGIDAYRNTLMWHLSSEIMLLDAPCQDASDSPFTKLEVAHKDVISMDNKINQIIKNFYKNSYF
ncbi:hypothetical protein GCM10008982_29030 [Anoxybacillus voinovskiensis]|nr:hypothetical protein GCM10008982_29030 [Anoxybacillus voinovskiensis]